MAGKKKSKVKGGTKSPKSTGKAARSRPVAKPTAAGKPVAEAGSTNQAPAARKKEASAARRKAANEPFHRAFGTRPGESRSRRVYELGNGRLEVPELKRLLEETLPQEGACHDVRIDHDLLGRVRKAFLVNARRLAGSPEDKGLTVLAWADVTQEAGS